MTIIIDTREPTKKILGILARWTGPTLPSIEFEKLDLADYLIDNNGHTMIIERKEIHDFCANHVILRQRMDKMRQRFENTALLTEGQYEVRNNTIWLHRGRSRAPSLGYNTFTNFIASQQARGSHYYHTQNLRETLLRVVNLHDYIHKMGKNPVRKSTKVENWIAELPGVGPATVEKISTQYSTPCDALEDIRNWIPTKSKKLLERWH